MFNQNATSSIFHFFFFLKLAEKEILDIRILRFEEMGGICYTALT